MALKNQFQFLISILLIFLAENLSGQGLTGPQQATAGVKSMYQFNDDYIIAEPRWVTESATIQTSRSGATFYAEVTWQTPGNFTLQFFDGEFLLASLSVEVAEGCTFPPKPNAGIDQVGVENCGKKSAELKGSAIPESNIGRWSIVSGAGGSFSDVTLPNAVFSGITGTDYLLRWSVGKEGCLSSDELLIRFHALPPDVPALSGDTRFGSGSFFLTASGAPSTSTYQWRNQEEEIIAMGSSVNTDHITVQQPRFGTVRILDQKGCTGEPRVVSLNIEPEPVAESTSVFLPEGGEVLLHVKGKYDLYIWKDLQDELIGTGPEIWISEPGVFYVEVTKTGIAGVGRSLPVEVKAPYRISARSKQIAETPAKSAKNSDELLVHDLRKEIRFLDGLGRPLQKVDRAWTANKEDRIEPFVYDSKGRTSYAFLPLVPGGSTDDYREDLLDENNQYQSQHLNFFKDPSPYTETTFEDNPLDRIKERLDPGINWKTGNRSIKFSNTSNINGTGFHEEQVIAWEVNDRTGLPARKEDRQGYIKNGHYSTGTLEVRSEKDEEGLETRIYKDAAGRIVLKKIQAVEPAVLQNSSHWAQTYYIYDAIGKLRFILQPELVQLLVQSNRDPSAAEISSLGFRYRYDALGRVITLQEPGKDSVYMIYDHRDRVVMTQDGNQRVSVPYRWTFFKYDELNRMIATGVRDTMAILTQSAMQTVVNNFYLKNSRIPAHEQFVGYSVSNIHGYTNRTYPIFTTGKTAEPDHYLRVMYFDQYGFSEGWGNPVAFVADDIAGAESWVGSLSGLQTGKKVKVLDGGYTGGSTWLGTTIYYDRFQRPVQIHSENYKGGVDITSLSYDFTGQLLRKRRVHQKQDLTWRDQRLIYSQGNKIICGNTKAGWTSGAVSAQILATGKDGWLEFIATERGTDRAIGLADQNINTNYTSIDYAIFLNNSGAINLFEQAAGKFISGNFGTYRSGDRFRIERKAGVIRYYRNGMLLRTSVYPSTGILFADISMSSPGSTIAGIRSSFSNENFKTEERFVSDHRGRITEVWHRTGQNPEILVSKNDYDGQGRLSSQSLHFSSSSLPPKQKIDYTYHIRGWMESVNYNENKIETVAAEYPDLFAQKLFYENAALSASISQPRFNGHISAIQIQTPYGSGEYAFAMNYDAMKRFSAGTHLVNTGTTGWKSSGNEERVTSYDLNGNIRSLIRKEQNVLTDDLTYQYQPTSNQLASIQDRSAEKFKSFFDGNNSAAEYGYDRNGNLSTDLNKGISQIIQYNILDLPEVINRGGNRFQMAYSAEGELLAETTIYGSNTVSNQKEWIGPIQYDQGLLHSVEQPEGRVVMQNTETLFTEDGSNRNVYSVSGASASAITLNGENYVAVTATSNTARSGIQTIGGLLSVAAGERYRVRIRGFRTAGTAKMSNPVFISVKLNGVDLDWPGASLPFSSATEHEIEQMLDIPSGGLLQIGLTWNSVSAGEIFYVNRAEISKVTLASPEYQYYLKDHLDNVRTVFTVEPDVVNRFATSEPSVSEKERKEFMRFDQVRMVTSSLFDRTNGSQSGTAVRLNGSSNERYGLASSISVMPGDVIETEVWAKYVDPVSQNWNSLLSGLMSLIVSGSTSVVKDGTAYSTSTSSFPYGSLQNTGGSSGNGPKAYLNWLVFDKKFNFLSEESGYVRMTTSAREYGQDVEHERLRSSEIKIKTPGYVYIYFSNEETTPLEVYFDDFKIIHRHSPVIQSADYFPFGSPFNQQIRENAVLVTEKFNSMTELNSLDLSWLRPSRYRSYDPITGRFMQIDPVVKDHESLYAWNTNNPVRFSDPFGADSAQRARALREAERYVRSNPDPGGNGGYGFAGFHAGKPGMPIDCSGMVSQCAAVSGFGTLNNYVRRKPNNNGVRNIIDQPLTKEVPIREITEGNIIVFPNNSHIAFVSDIVRDNQKNVTGFTLIHSEGTGGPNKDVIDLNNANNYYVRKYLGVGASRARFYSWDTPDKPLTPQQSTIKK